MRKSGTVVERYEDVPAADSFEVYDMEGEARTFENDTDAARENEIRKVIGNLKHGNATGKTE